MLSCDNNHFFTEPAMPNDHDGYDHTSGRCPCCDGEPFEIEDGVMQAIDADGVMHDVDPVNSLLQKEDRVSVAFGEFTRSTATLALLLLFGFMFAMAIATPDERVTGWMSNDAVVMEVTR